MNSLMPLPEKDFIPRLLSVTLRLSESKSPTLSASYPPDFGAPDGKVAKKDPSVYREIRGREKAKTIS